MKLTNQSAFSLIELLVALSVVSIVAAVIAPRFLNVQQQARDTVAQQVASQLNHTLAEWTAAGGTVGSNAATSDILSVLTGDSGGLLSMPQPAPSDSTLVVSDCGTSNSVRASVPGDFAAAVAAATNAGGSSMVISPQVSVVYDSAGGQFLAVPASRLSTPYNQSSLFGDVDGNGVVDNKDLVFMKAALNRPANYIAALDYDHDGDIDNVDFLHFRANQLLPPAKPLL